MLITFAVSSIAFVIVLLITITDPVPLGSAWFYVRCIALAVTLFSAVVYFIKIIKSK